MEQLTADRRGVAGGADHGDGVGPQERAHRVHRGLGLPVLEVRDGLVGEQDRELDLDRAGRCADRDREAARAEDVDHLVVLGQDLGDERRDAVPGRLLRHLPEQDRTHALALELVGGGQADLGAPSLDPDVLGAADHAALVAPLEHEQRQVVVVVDVDDLAGEPPHVDRLRPEPKAPRLRRQADQVVLDAGGVGGPRGPDPHGRAVAEHHVRDQMLGEGGRHAVILVPEGNTTGPTFGPVVEGQATAGSGSSGCRWA